MRRLFLLLLVTLTAAAAFAWLVRLDAGYVLLQFHGTRIETTVWFALVALLASLLLFYYLARALVLLAAVPGRLGGAAPVPGRARRARAGAARAALAWIEGRWEDAARLLAADARRSESPLLNYVLAARAASRSGDAALARGFLAMAEELPGAKTPVAIERASLQLQAGEHAAALASLDALANANQPAAIALLLDVLPACGAWDRLLDLLPEAQRLALRPEAELQALARQAAAALLAQCGTDPAALRACWEDLPQGLRRDHASIACYARVLSAAGGGAQALEVLESALKKEWSAPLVRALGEVRGADTLKQLARADRLSGAHLMDPELLIALGRIALQNRLWAKARDYLDASLARAPRAETCAELARACEQLGDAEKSRVMRERAVTLALG